MCKLTTFLFILGLFGCADSQVADNTTNPHNFSPKIQTDSNETINIDSVLINDKIPFQTTIDNLKRILGEADYKEKEKSDCGNYFNVGTVIIYRYGQTTFEQYGDSVVLQKINFTDGHFKIKTTKLTFDDKTTLDLVRQFFPLSTARSHDYVDATDKTYELIIISPKPSHDNQYWLLTFHNGRLIEMEYCIPC